MRVRKNSKKDSQYDFIGQENIKDIEFALPLSNTRRMLSFFGALPCTGKRPYWPSYDRREANIFYSVALLSAITGIVLFVAVDKRTEYDRTDPSLATRRTMLFESTVLLALNPIVFSVWADVSEFVHFMKLLSTLQIKYRRTTGKPLEYRKHTFEQISCNVSVVFTISFYYVLAYFVVDMDLSPFVCAATVYGHIIGLLVVIHWNFAAMIIVDAQKDMESELKQSKDLTANKVFEFRLLWLSLRALADCKGQWNSSSFGYTILLGMSVTTAYVGVGLLLEGEIGGVVSNLSVTVVYVIVIYLSLRASHEVEEKMKCLVKEVLPNISLSCYNKGVQREILMLFLVESARPVQTTFKESVVVNRNLFVTFFSTVATYIIVLVQFNKQPPTP